MESTSDDNFLLSDQDTNQFWCRPGLNPESFIQPLEILPIELIGTHVMLIFSYNMTQCELDKPKIM